MSKKYLFITIIACIVCSAGSFFIGYSLPKNVASNEDGPAQEEQSDPDSKYIGVYLAEYYNGGKQIIDKFELKDNHECSSGIDCEWSITDDKLTITSTAPGGQWGKSLEECERALADNNEYPKNSSTNWVITEKGIDDYHKEQGVVCYVTTRGDSTGSILPDGSILIHGAHYYKQ